jgi:hypothetical protein
MNKMNVALADSLMGVFGFTRVTTDEEIAKMEEAQEAKDDLMREENGEVSNQPQPKFVVGDHAFVNGTWREVRNVVWEEDHYEYEMHPYDSKMNTEDELN